MSEEFTPLTREELLSDITVTSNIIPEPKGAWNALVRFDHFLSGIGGNVTSKEESEINRFVQDKDEIAKYLPHYIGESPREIYKRTRILLFPVKINFDDMGFVENIGEGTTKILLDFHSKGKQKKGKQRPDFYILS